MIVSNLIDSWITVNDIGLKIPPKGKGEVFADDDKCESSDEIRGLVSAGMVTLASSGITGIRPTRVKGVDGYAVPSTDIWGGARHKHNFEKVEVDAVEKTMSRSEKVISDLSQRRFRIRRLVDFNVSVEKAKVVLSKQVPEATIEASAYYDESTQRAVAAGHIELVEVFEKVVNGEGEGEWVPTKKRDDNTIPGAELGPDGAPCVFWEGPIFDGGGYANMNRQYIFNLDKMGVHVKPTLVSTLMDVESEVRDKVIALSYNAMPIQSPKVFATNVPNQHYGRSIGYTMMETENRIHPLLVQKLLVADELWVPCEWNRNIFKNSGVKRDIHVMPLGVDDTQYHPADRSVFFGSGTNTFTFLSVFNWNWRKGFDVLLKAYIRAFRSTDDVSLVMVSRFVGQKSMSQRIFDDIKACTSRERQDDRPHLSLVDDVIPTFLMPRIYNSADAFALFSRGEGFGLPYCEAAASGLPVLGADHGGQKMFMNEDVAMMVRPDKVSCVHSSIKTISPFYFDMEFADYTDKAVDEAAEKMRMIYDNRDDSSVMADRFLKRITGGFTWRHAAERVAERLREIQP